MDFDFSDEQRLLKDSVDRFISERYGFEDRKNHARSNEGWSRGIWTQFAELGILGLPFDESDGGFGGGAVETMIVMEALGRGLVLEPYFATIVLAGGLLRHGGSAELKQRIIPRIVSGELVLSFAHSERQARYELNSVSTTVRHDGGGWVINGRKTLVLHGDSADQLIVSARIDGNTQDRQGICLFLVDCGAPGVVRRGYATQDGLRAAEVSFQNVRVNDSAIIGQVGAALPVIERAVDEALAALCAEAVGAMNASLDLTIEYLKTRRQFGAVLGSFQALQHQAADMLVGLELARSLSLFASMMAQDDHDEARHRAVATAKIQIGWSAKQIGQKTIQLHGGIGMTEEYSAGHYFKRLTMLDFMLGTADHHISKLAQLDRSTL